MNQKQRDYLVKRLQKLAEMKKVSFRVEDPDVKPFIKKLKLKSFTDIMSIKGIQKLIKIEPHRNGWTKKDSINGLDNDSEYLHTKDFYTNFDEIDEQIKEFCKKHYSIVDKRKNSVDDKCEELCDKIILAESYEEALEVIQEFSKF